MRPLGRPNDLHLPSHRTKTPHNSLVILVVINAVANRSHPDENLPPVEKPSKQHHEQQGHRGDPGEIPAIVRGATDNGAWFHSRHLWWQNESTSDLPDLVDRRSFNELLTSVDPAPKSPKAALQSLHPRPGFRVELVAAEPLVRDPVSFAWGPDGKFWVVEMADYPLGLDDRGEPGGRVRYLEDCDGDGKGLSVLIFTGNRLANGNQAGQLCKKNKYF